MQLYIYVSTTDHSPSQNTVDAYNINEWMGHNFLRRKTVSTEVNVFTSENSNLEMNI